MLDDEQALQRPLNEAGQIAMQPMFEQFDTNGEPIRVEGNNELQNITNVQKANELLIQAGHELAGTA